MKKNNALVLGFTKDWAFSAGSLLLSLRRFSPDFADDIFIYHDGIDNNMQSSINHIYKCIFIKYQFPYYEDLSKYPQMQYYSNLMFSRFECLSLLESYHNIFWFDCDTLIINDIEPIKYISSTSDLGLTPGDPWFEVQNNFFSPVDGYIMKTKMYNSGIIHFSDRISNPEDIKTWMYEAVKRYAPILNWPDQGILNLAIQEFGLDVHDIPLDEYSLAMWKEKSVNAKLVHAYGYEKFWNSPSVYEKYPEWLCYNKIFSDIINIYEKNYDQPEISVVMPVYNAEKFIKESIESIITQTYRNFEFIIIDGGSTDNTLKIISSFLDSRIILIQSETCYISKNLNKGIKMARGKYIVRMDADDISLPDRLRLQKKYLDIHPEISLLATHVRSFGTLEQDWKNNFTHDRIRTQLIFGTPFVHPSIMFRKEDFLSNNFLYDENLITNEDFELWQRSSEKLTFAFLDKQLLLYRLHDNNNATKLRVQKTAEVERELIFRSFKKLHVHLSENELLLLDSHENKISNTSIAYVFFLLCRNIVKFYKNNLKMNIYDPGDLKITIVEKFNNIFFIKLHSQIQYLLSYLNLLWNINSLEFHIFYGTTKYSIQQSIFQKNTNFSQQNTQYTHKKYSSVKLNANIKYKLSVDYETFKNIKNPFNEYKTLNKECKLQICSGKNHLRDWFNTDFIEDAEHGIFHLDVTKRFPFPDLSFAYIFWEHGIEHFELETVIFILKECNRVLKNSGIIRIATPDMKKLINYYERDSELHNEYTDFQLDTHFDYAKDINLRSKCYIFNEFYRTWGHKLIFDADLLKDILQRSGFTKIVGCEISKSSHIALQNIDSHGGTWFPEKFNELETMIYEGTKVK